MGERKHFEIWWEPEIYNVDGERWWRSDRKPFDADKLPNKYELN